MQSKWAKLKVEKTSDTEVNVEKWFILRNKGKSAEIEFTRKLFSSKNLYLKRTKDKCVLINEKGNRGIIISWTDNNVSIVQASGSMLKRTLTVTR